MFFPIKTSTFAPAPGDQLLQNSPRAETQQGYVVERCAWRFFNVVNEINVVNVVNVINEGNGEL